MKFRRLRSKIIFSFCVLMVTGGLVTTMLVQHNLSRSLSESADQHGLAFARAMAGQLAEPIAYSDRLGVRSLLERAQAANENMVYLFVSAPDGTVTDHSYPTNAFPFDLLQLAPRTRPSTLQTEIGLVRDLPAPVLGGVLGTVHVGNSMSSIATITSAAVKNVLWVTGLAMIVGIAGIFFIANLITRPVQHLMEAARKVGQGEFDSAAPVIGNDELADLAIAFNRMATQVRDRMAESEGLRIYLDRVLDHMSAGVIVVSATKHLEYANRVIRDGYGSIVGRQCSAVLSEERPCSECPVAQVTQSRQVVTRPFTSNSGRMYELTYMPFHGQNGHFSVVETALDVTETSLMSKRLQRAERLAVTGEVAAGVVHSINNPLDGVRRALELAMHDPTDLARSTRMLSLAVEGTDRIAKVTRTLLDLARADGVSEPVPVALNSVVTEAVKLVQLRAHENSIIIRLDLAPLLPDLMADPRGIQEVVVNLLLNAVDAITAGGDIVITTRQEGAGIIAMTVADNGAGIPADQIEHIFEAFFTTKEVGRGTGLGLSVARRIITAHGGDIQVESNLGKGTTFRVTLPLPQHQGSIV